MEKVLWSKKRLRLFLSLNRPVDQNDIEAYATLNAFVQRFPQQATHGDRSLLKACKVIEDSRPDKVNEQSREAINRFSAEL